MTQTQAIKQLILLRQAFPVFVEFVKIFFKRAFGFYPTPMQLDIAEYMGNGMRFKMVQAQRGEAKTSLTMLYIIWRYIGRPDLLVMIVSSESTNAYNIGSGVNAIIQGDPYVECLRGIGDDRSGLAVFDINRQIAKRHKDPSFTSISIGGSFQSKRADLIIGDDIESAKNTDTPGKVEKILKIMADFPNLEASTPIEILYLGTPQHTNSTYNILPKQGFDVRKYPGRYPPLGVNVYGEQLAPFIAERMADNPALRTGYGVQGTRGAVTDPKRHDEAFHIGVEEKSRNGSYELQQLLDVSIAEGERYPLKLEDLVVTAVDQQRAPVEFEFENSQDYCIDTILGLYRPKTFSKVEHVYSRRIAFIDPAFSGSDETVVTIALLLSPNIWIPAKLHLKGGFTESNLVLIAKFIQSYVVNEVYVEINNGGNSLTTNLERTFRETTRRGIMVIPHTTGSTAKEVRIVESLAPLLQNHQLIFSPSLINADNRIAIEEPQRALLYQIQFITTAKNALSFDDAIDSLAMCCAILDEHLHAGSAKTFAQFQEEKYLRRLHERKQRQSPQKI